ncbi:hypothetical protein [Streptococcus equi]|uniref:hypothetical protein n=1 Tax=Streptococcus equi TaxID=1336 RepID=UPI001E592ED0|nr:hypothetical protein [Streptococcus equi]
MLIPITEYYIEEEYAYALRLMRQMLERQRIATVARLANSQGEAIKKRLKTRSKRLPAKLRKAFRSWKGS